MTIRLRPAQKSGKEAREKDRDVTEKIEDLQRIKEILIALIDSFAGGRDRKRDCPILHAPGGESKAGRIYDGTEQGFYLSI